MDIEPRNQNEIDQEEKLRNLKKAKTSTFIIGVIGVYFLYLTLVTFKGKWTGNFAELPVKTLVMCIAFLIVGIVLVVFAIKLNKGARRLERRLWEEAHPGEDFDEFMKSQNQRSVRNPRASAAAQPMAQSNKMSDRLAQLKRLNEMADADEDDDEAEDAEPASAEFSYEPAFVAEGSDELAEDEKSEEE